MSFIDCIQGSETLSKTKREELIREYNEIISRNQAKYGGLDGPQRAAQSFMEMKTREAVRRKANLLAHTLKVDELVNSTIKAAPEYGAKKKGWGASLYLKSNVAGVLYERLTKIGIMAGADNERALRSISDVLRRYASKAAGLKQDTKGMRDVVDEMLGKKTGNAVAAEDAKRVARLFEALHRAYVSAGGVIGKLPNYFPQRDIPDIVKNVSFDEWAADKHLWVDRDKMIDPTSGMKLDDEEFNTALKEAYDSIINNGLDDIAIGTETASAAVKGTIATRKSARRFFFYKDADSFHANNAKYGGGDANLFDNMVDYVHSITRDTTIIRELGPNSDAVAEVMVSLVKTDNAKPVVQQTVRGMYDVVSGANSYGGSAGILTRGIENTQNLLRAFLLGGAPVSAMGDSFFGVMSAKMNGLDGTNALKNWASYLNPADASDRMFAEQAVFVGGFVNGNSIAQSRHADITGSGRTRFLASFVNRASGLGIQTDAIRAAVPLEAMGFMARAKASKTKFSELPQEMLDAFKRWDMNEGDFNNIMKAEPHRPDASKAEFIRSEDIAGVSAETARRFDNWLYDMSQLASNEPALLTRAITTGAVAGNAVRGSVARNTATSVLMFKSFAITSTLNHILPALQRGATEGKWGRAAAMATVLPLVGAGVVQAKQVLYGRTPKDMDSIDFWKQAALQSGVFGVVGDYAFSDVNRYDYSLGKQIAGPAPQLLTDVAKTFYGNFEKAIQDGEESAFIKDLSKLTTRYTPKLWYTRLLQERIFLDAMNRAADPLYDKKMNQVERRMKKETGSEYWYGPGD